MEYTEDPKIQRKQYFERHLHPIRKQVKVEEGQERQGGKKLERKIKLTPNTCLEHKGEVCQMMFIEETPNKQCYLSPACDRCIEENYEAEQDQQRNNFKVIHHMLQDLQNQLASEYQINKKRTLFKDLQLQSLDLALHLREMAEKFIKSAEYFEDFAEEYKLHGLRHQKLDKFANLVKNVESCTNPKDFQDNLRNLGKETYILKSDDKLVWNWIKGESFAMNYCQRELNRIENNFECIKIKLNKFSHKQKQESSNILTKQEFQTENYFKLVEIQSQLNAHCKKCVHILQPYGLYKYGCAKNNFRYVKYTFSQSSQRQAYIFLWTEDDYYNMGEGEGGRKKCDKIITLGNLGIQELYNKVKNNFEVVVID